jgi:hypothetical protein
MTVEKAGLIRLRRIAAAAIPLAQTYNQAYGHLDGECTTHVENIQGQIVRQGRRGRP